jgi:hypothetical protein
MKKLNYITLLFFVALAFASCSKSVWMEEVTSVGTERSEIVDGTEVNTDNDIPTNSSVSNNNRNSEGDSDITDDEDDGITDDEDEDDTDQTGKKKK